MTLWRAVKQSLRRFNDCYRVPVRVHIHIGRHSVPICKHGIRVAQLGRRIFSLFGAHPASRGCVSRLDFPGSSIEFIKRKPYGNRLLVKVKDEVAIVIDATPGYESCDRRKIIEQNKKNAVRHAYFKEYLTLQRLCLLILRHQKHQLGSGVRQIYGILFDGAWLWEEYISLLIDDKFYHPMNKNGSGAQRLFDGNVGLIYPDFISRDTGERIIADAKYKPTDNIGNRDYLQVLAYMFRFDAKAGYYLYPEAGGADDRKLWMNRGSTYEDDVIPRNDVFVIKHSLKIPNNAPNYAEFVARMKISEQEFRRAFSPGAEAAALAPYAGK